MSRNLYSGKHSFNNSDYMVLNGTFEHTFHMMLFFLLTLITIAVHARFRSEPDSIVQMWVNSSAITLCWVQSLR